MNIHSLIQSSIHQEIQAGTSTTLSAIDFLKVLDQGLWGNPFSNSYKLDAESIKVIINPGEGSITFDRNGWDVKVEFQTESGEIVGISQINSPEAHTIQPVSQTQVQIGKNIHNVLFSDADAMVDERSNGSNLSLSHLLGKIIYYL